MPFSTKRDVKSADRRSTVYRFARAWTLALLLLLVSASGVAAQAVCDDTTLNTATGTYDFGLFAQTFALIQPCLPDGFPAKNQRVRAYRLMALSYSARDSLGQARESVRLLLKVDSGYQPDPQTDPQPYIKMVSDLKPRWYTWLWRGNEWYKWTGRAVVAGGLASLPFLLRKDIQPDLPVHPGFPDR